MKKNIFLIYLVTCSLFSLGQSKESINKIEHIRKTMKRYAVNDSLFAVGFLYSTDAQVNGFDFKSIDKKSILEYWKNIRGKGVNWEWEVLSITGNDTYIFETGISKLTLSYNEIKRTYSSLYNVIWHRESNGGFKLIFDFYRQID